MTKSVSAHLADWVAGLKPEHLDAAAERAAMPPGRQQHVLHEIVDVAALPTEQAMHQAAHPVLLREQLFACDGLGRRRRCHRGAVDGREDLGQGSKPRAGAQRRGCEGAEHCHRHWSGERATSDRRPPELSLQGRRFSGCRS